MLDGGCSCSRRRRLFFFAVCCLAAQLLWVLGGMDMRCCKVQKLLQPVAVANHARNKFIVKQQRAALVRSRVGSTQKRICRTYAEAAVVRSWVGARLAESTASRAGAEAEVERALAREA